MGRLLLGAALLLTACQQPPALQAPAASSLSPAAQLRAEGDALMAGGNYAGAVEKFRQAIDLEPTSVPLRFGLGTAYSFLDRRSEAIAQFRWVVANAAAESTEASEPLAVTGGVTLITDYRFRGVTQTNEDPAIQGTINFNHESGFYAGVWASTIDGGLDGSTPALTGYGDAEVDLYAG